MRICWVLVFGLWAAACSDSHAPSSQPGTDTARQGSGGAGQAGTAVPADRDLQPGDSARTPDDPSAEPPADGDRDGDRPRDPSTGDAPGDGQNAGGEPARADDPGASSDENGDQDGDQDAAATAPSGALAELLFGHWWGGSNTGDCIDIRSWYSFAADGTVVSRSIDHNACSAARLLSATPGRYVLDGRELEITLDGAGADRPFDMTMTSTKIARRIERMTIAIAERPATSTLAAQTFLDAHAYSSSDGARFDSQRSVIMTDVSGTIAFEQKVAIVMELDPPLPLAEGTHLQVQVHASFAELDAATEGVSLADTIALRFPATIRAELGWLRIMPDALEGWSGQEALDAWRALLVNGGITSHPDWSRRLLEANFFPSQRFTPGNSTLLTSTLPEWGRWQRSAEPPPVL